MKNKFKPPTMMKPVFIILIIFVILFIFLITEISAEIIPLDQSYIEAVQRFGSSEANVLPHTILYNNDSQVKRGDFITAKIGNKHCGHFLVRSDGFYGQLACLGSESDNGKEIRLFVNNQPTETNGKVYFSNQQTFNFEITNIINYNHENIGMPGTMLTECGNRPTIDGCTISQSVTFIRGDYFLLHGIVITGNNVVLNCNGSELHGDFNPGTEESGIFVLGNNTLIKNCILSGYNVGITNYNFTLGSGNNKNIKIINNTMQIFLAGILLDHGTNISIENNTLPTAPPTEGDFSINLLHGTNISIENNTLSEQQVIRVSNSNEGVTIKKNTNFTAFLYQINGNITIMNNKIAGDVTLHSVGENITISNNKMDNGIIEFTSNQSVYRLNYVNITNNSVLGIEIFYENYPFSPGNSTVNIENNEFSGNFSGIILENNNLGNYSTMNINVKNNLFSNNTRTDTYYYAISNYRGSYPATIKIINNTFINNLYAEAGLVHILTSKNVELGLNTFEDNDVTANIAIWRSTNLNIHDNSFGHTGNPSSDFHGIYMSNSSGYPNNNVNIYNNEFINNRDGIYIINCNGGENNHIYRNHFASNNYGLISTTCSEGTYIHENLFTSNIYGVGLYDQENYNFYLNNLQYNQYYDVATNIPGAEFSYNNQGNYWGNNNPPCFRPGNDSNRSDVNDSHASCSVIQMTEINIPIVSGWNFISFNVMPENTNTQSVLYSIEGNYDKIQSFINGDLLTYEVGSQGNTLTNLSPWYGYWLHSNSTEPTTLRVIGGLISYCHNLTLSANTHWIGNWLNEPLEAPTALNSIAGNYDFIQTYSNGQIKTYAPDLPSYSDLWIMTSGQAYRINMTNQDNLDYICRI